MKQKMNSIKELPVGFGILYMPQGDDPIRAKVCGKISPKTKDL
jgi:hypothetical protein